MPKHINEMKLQKALESIPETTVHGRAFLQRAMNYGWLNDIEAQDGWVSVSNVLRKSIRIGVGAIPETIRDKVAFGDPSQDELLRHRIIHELGHFVIGYGYTYHEPTVELLTQYMQAIRDETGDERGLSGIGSLQFYGLNGVGRWNEDATDLFAEYVRDPRILERHLDYLSDGSRAEEHKAYGLYTLKPVDAGMVYDAVEAVANKYAK